ncbi:HNH endonuclease signature motif containing protein [[Mycobacterium] holstebronense]|uniref:HNH endonuclease signature motif containing protein n=1 Tax=[Mycobacterium] holstebronense TaxID=3064288 RepID=A0ABN9N290_9MYCO|nr:HNH endonuclease signature motif containing protein [Mycolicibacter sp. MU0102]CAJ1499227.1 HNH endonuclease signature motif containing protein [Mycolicibacter sp. MU0102]
MRSSNREAILEVFDALATALDRALDLDFEALTPRECLALLGRCERLRRRLPAVEHPLVNRLAGTDPAELGGKPRWVLADELRISRGEAGRRLAEAAELGARRTLTGEALDPVLPAVATAQREGKISTAHIAVIRSFFTYLPDAIDAGTLTQAEQHLTALGTDCRPDELAKLAQRLADHLQPDGNYTEDDRAKRRGIVLGSQDRDGMTPIKGYLDPQARATWDAVLARWAAPGMCNPNDATPCTGGTPSQTQIDADARSAAQRNHDALTAMGRALLASGNLGQHNGLPATIIVSTTLADLESGTGKAHTGGGTWLPIRDVIAMASHAHHYLRIYDGAKELALFHTKRLASPAQRIVLYARERGCSHPNCPISGYFCEVHHDEDYAKTRRTDITDLTLRCGPHHQLITSGGWKTRKRHDGTTQTLPPPHLDHGQPRVNHYHHPEKLLGDNGSSADDDGP